MKRIDTDILSYASAKGIEYRQLDANRYELSVDIGCNVHRRCGSKIRHRHHSPPQSWAAGVDGVAFKIYHLCPNAHEGEVHVGIDEQIRDGHIHRHYGSKVRAIIDEAFSMAEAYGLTPKPTL